MTKEEAIRRLKEAKGTTQPFLYVDEAIDYVVKALESKTDTWSIKEVADSLEKHGLIREQEPCEDAISRQAVLGVQAKYAEYVGATKFWQMRDDIKALPSVTPQSKTGRWIRVDKDKLRCSECEIIHLIAQYPNGKIDWCPNCGAKMESEDKNNGSNENDTL